MRNGEVSWGITRVKWEKTESQSKKGKNDMGILWSQYLGVVSSGQGDICKVFICPQIFERLYWRWFQICKSVNVRRLFSFFPYFDILYMHQYNKTWIDCDRVNKLLMTTSTNVWSPYSITVSAIDAMIIVENAFPTLAIYSWCQDTNHIYWVITLDTTYITLPMTMIWG